MASPISCASFLPLLPAPGRHWPSRLCNGLRLLALLALPLTPVCAAPITPAYTLRIWHQADGMPSNDVTGLCLDRNGYLWVATPAGLARFDGARFVRFDPTPGNAPVDPGFVAILPGTGDEDVIAAPATGGLLRLIHGRFEAVALPARLNRHLVADLFRAADGALWVSFKEGLVVRLLDGQSEVFGPEQGLDPAQAISLARNDTGQTWLTNGLLLARYEAGNLIPVSLNSHREELRVESALKDGPWVITRGWLFKVEDGRVNRITKINSNLNAHYVQAFLEEPGDVLWFGTRSRGLRRRTADGDSNLIIRAPEDISAIAKDAAGNLWVGSNGGGLVRVRPGVLRRFDQDDGLLENHSLTVCQDGAGTMWLANRDGGVAYINDATRIMTLDRPPGRDNFTALSVAPAGDAGVWVTSSDGFLRADLKHIFTKNEPSAPPQPPPGEMRVTYAARNGDVWLALGAGRLARLRSGEWVTFGSAEGLGDDAVAQTITEDPQGRIWVGSDDTRVFRLEGGRFSRVPLAVPAATGAIQAIYFDATGIGWLGLQGRGLLRLDENGGRLLDGLHGLPATNITQIIGDDHGVIWFGSPNGIFHLRRAELENFFAGRIAQVDPVIIGADEGLSEATCLGSYQPSVWKSRDGLLWFATRQGLVAIDPDREKTGLAPLRVKIDTVRSDGQPHAAAPTVRVAAGAHNVEIDYAVLCLSTPERVRTRIRLQGYEDDWADAGPGRIARYARLPPGEYRFEVSARLAGVPGSEVADSLTLFVAAAWWQTVWFQLGEVCLGLLALVLAVRAWSHRRLRARLVRLEHQSTLEQERARIAQNIHDDLGSGLTRISLLTQSAAHDASRAQLDRIYNTVSELTQSMDEIVWAVNPKNDDLESLANYLGEFAQGFLTDAGLRCRVFLPSSLPKHTLTSQYRHHLFLSCKEALNNAVKHAQASEVSLRFHVSDDRLFIVIADNGRGLPSTARLSKGNGLANLRARMAALGGTCEIASPASGGTTLTFTAVLPPAASPS